MSYIDLINAFERWLETNYLPSSSQLLWYKLISFFNKCGWSEWVLVEAKLFEYKKGKKGSPNQYKINTVNFTVQTTVEMTVNTTVETTAQVSNINRLRLDKDKKEINKEKNLKFKNFEEDMPTDLKTLYEN